MSAHPLPREPLAQTLAYDAMQFAHEAHANQRRKYTHAPYVQHLVEVAGLVASVAQGEPRQDVWLATAYLHDYLEDQGGTFEELRDRFGSEVAHGVFWLTAIHKDGPREQRKALDRERLARAPSWVQTIKVADIISNASTIEQYDPEFARIYLPEKRRTLDLLTRADARLLVLARKYVGAS